MGFFSTVFGLFGFGIGIAIGLVIGYFLFIYWKSADVENPIIRPLNELDSKSLEKLMPEIPLWVKNPDFDRVDWLNRFIGDLWPYLDKAICKIIRETTKPMLEEYRSKFKIDAIDFECLTLGTLPPTLQGIKAYDTAEREMIIEPALKWAGNPNITVAVKAFGIKATVQLVDLQVFAVARVTLKPLVPCFPCFSKILVSLMDKPHIDFGLKLMGGDLMAIPGLYGMVQDIIKDQVGNMYLWPKALEVAVLDEKIAAKRPVGMLQVKVISAQGLRKADFMGKSDPYVKLSLGGSLLDVKKTKVQMKTLNPVWNENFMFLVQDPESQALELNLYDWEKVSSRHDKLGMQVVPLHTIVPGEKTALTLNIEKNMNPNDPSNKKPRGQIMLELMYQPFKRSDTILEEGEQGTGNSSEETPEAGGGMLCVHVHEAKDVEGKHHSNFYVKLTLRGDEKKTKCIKKTRNPRWDEDFKFMLEVAPVDDKIRVEVISKGKGFTSYGKEIIGYVEINLAGVVNNTRINDNYQLIDSKTGEIQIELEWTKT